MTNQETKKKNSLEWYYKNKEKSITQSTEWRKRNKERYNTSRRKRYQERKDELRAQMRDYYQRVRRPKRLADPETTKKKDREAGLKRIEKLRKCIQQTKLDMGGMCARCGYSEQPRILQFHHLNGGENKLGNISEMKSQRKIREEAKKCELLCPNCHALEHLNHD